MVKLPALGYPLGHKRPSLLMVRNMNKVVFARHNGVQVLDQPAIARSKGDLSVEGWQILLDYIQHQM